MTKRWAYSLGALLVLGISAWTVAPYARATDSNSTSLGRSLPAKPTLRTSATAPVDNRILPVAAVEVRKSDHYRVKRSFTGYLEARRESSLGFETGGRLRQVQVQEGDRVLENQILAILDGERLHLQKAEAVAQLAEARATLEEMKAGARQQTVAAALARVRELEHQLDLADLQTERRKQLLEGGEISAEELDLFAFERDALRERRNAAHQQFAELEAGTRQEQLDAQAARIQRLEARVSQIDLELERTSLRAPFAGTITSRFLDEGVVVQAGTPVLQLLEDSVLEARIGLPVAAADWFRSNSSIELRVGNRNLTGHLKTLLPDLDAATRTRPAIFEIPEPGTAVAGEIVRAQFDEVVQQDGFWIPLTALEKGERGLWSLYALQERSQGDQAFAAERRLVEVLHVETQRAYVRGTLQEGDWIVQGGLERVTPGQPVEPVFL